MPYRQLHVLPLVLFTLFPMTFLITYAVSVFWDHVAPVFPYISETGTYSPESRIFSQFLNIAALLLACCVYIRHRQVLQWQMERGRDLVSRRMVLATTWFGALTCIGLDILANFQEAGLISCHMFGAMTCFFAGIVYFCLQTYLSYNMVPALNSWTTFYVRVGLSMLTFILIICMIVPGFISMTEFQGDNYKKWLPKDGGWGWHVVSAISEWMLVIVYCTFLLTFVPDFRLVCLEDPVVTVLYRDKEQSNNTTRKAQTSKQEF